MKLQRGSCIRGPSRLVADIQKILTGSGGVGRARTERESLGLGNLRLLQLSVDGSPRIDHKLKLSVGWTLDSRN